MQFGHSTENHLAIVRRELHIVWQDPRIDHKTSLMTISSIPWRIPVQEFIRKSCCSRNKTHIRWARPGIFNKYWRAKLVYCFSGTKKLWYENWNRHVCHKRNYEVDRPPRSTQEKQGKKQKCCSLSSLWSQYQWDTSGPRNSQTLGCLWTKHHQCTFMWNWTDMPTVSFRFWAKTV